MQRYHRIPELNLDDFMNLIDFIATEEQEERIWQRWIIHYQMQMGFREFKAQLEHGQNGGNEDEKEILRSVKDILNAVRRDDA